jgi:parvulin-like peptidyl-prolyl isomerase
MEKNLAVLVAGRRALPGIVLGSTLAALGAVNALAADAAAPSPDAAAEKTAAAPATPLPPGIMLRINGKDIPKERFVAELDAAMGESYRETFSGHVHVEEKASQLGITASDAEINAHVQTNVDQVLGGSFGGDMDRMKGALEERGMTMDGWKKRLRLEARSEVLTEKLVRKERTVSDETLQRLFEERYGPGGTQVKVRHILKNVLVAASQEYTLQQYDLEKSKLEEDAKSRAGAALGKVRSGTAFEAVMTEYSDDPRKASGGVLTSWKGRFGADFDAAAAKIAKNGVSDVVKCPDGYRIVQCTDVTQAEELHALHILIAFGARAKLKREDEARSAAEDLLTKIKAGADFGELAKAHSDDPGSAQRGGDMGWFGRRAMVKPFEDAAFALSPGQISDVVKTSFGFHIIKLLEKRSTEDKTLRQIQISTQFAAVKDRKLRPALEAKARTELESIQADIAAKKTTFADAARSRTDDTATKTDGGLLKSYREGMYGGDFDAAVKSMKPSDPPRIVKDAAGSLHLVVVDEIVKTDFAKVRATLEAEEMQRVPTPQEKSDFLGRLRDDATVLF